MILYKLCHSFERFCKAYGFDNLQMRFCIKVTEKISEALYGHRKLEVSSFMYAFIHTHNLYSKH